MFGSAKLRCGVLRRVENGDRNEKNEMVLSSIGLHLPLCSYSARREFENFVICHPDITVMVV